MIKKLNKHFQLLEYVQIWLTKPKYSLIKISGGWYWEWLGLNGERLHNGYFINATSCNFFVERKILIPKFSKQEEKVQRALGLIGEGTPYILSKEFSTN